MGRLKKGRRKEKHKQKEKQEKRIISNLLRKKLWKIKRYGHWTDEGSWIYDLNIKLKIKLEKKTKKIFIKNFFKKNLKKLKKNFWRARKFEKRIARMRRLLTKNAILLIKNTEKKNRACDESHARGQNKKTTENNKRGHGRIKGLSPRLANGWQLAREYDKSTTSSG